MFENCSSLIEIKVAFTNWNNSATSHWVENISSKGVFIKPANLSDKYDSYSIPNKWETK